MVDFEPEMTATRIYTSHSYRYGDIRQLSGLASFFSVSYKVTECSLAFFKLSVKISICTHPFGVFSTRNQRFHIWQLPAMGAQKPISVSKFFRFCRCVDPYKMSFTVDSHLVHLLIQCSRRVLNEFMVSNCVTTSTPSHRMSVSINNINGSRNSRERYWFMTFSNKFIYDH